MASVVPGNAAAVRNHFVAVSTNAKEVGWRSGIDTDNMLRVLGLGRGTLLVRLGHRPFTDDLDRPEHFREMLAGFRSIDEAFSPGSLRTQPFLLCWAFIGIWYTARLFGAETHAVPALQPCSLFQVLRLPSTSSTWTAMASP